VSRPLRSVLIGDVDHYPSEYAFGVNQAMTMAGHWHTSVNIRLDMGAIAKRVREMQPDIIWGHMLLWAPGDHYKTPDLLDLCAAWRKRGTRVLLHDGDARTDTRCPMDVSTAIDLALCNHRAPRTVWHIPQLHWPYFCFWQEARVEPVPEFQCDLAFAGRLDGSGIYQHRTELVLQLKDKLGDRMKIFPGGDQHTVFRTPEVAASAKAVLGYGRPGRNGWLDVRVFQYPGAGAILLHDDVGEMLKPHAHYIPYESGSVDAILAALDLVTSMSDKAQHDFRWLAFSYTQAMHSASARVKQALEAVGLHA